MNVIRREARRRRRPLRSTAKSRSARVDAMVHRARVRVMLLKLMAGRAPSMPLVIHLLKTEPGRAKRA